MATETLNITMLGPSGVGKTSLLASMYREFDTSANALALELTPDLSSAKKLGDKIKELTSQATDDFYATGGVSGTRQEHKFEFGLGLRGKNPRLNIVFHDYPGGYLEQTEKQEIVKKHLLDSDVILLAIDAPALMEEPTHNNIGRYSELTNSSILVSAFFKKVFQDSKDEKLVLLVPMKCESYLKEKDNKAKPLITNVKTEYGSLLKTCSLKEEKLAVAITAVQTMGNVEFRYIDKTNQPHRFVFRRISRDYKPKNIDQPLKYALAFLISKHLRNRSFWQKSKDLFSTDVKDFKEALQKLTKTQSLKGFEGNDQHEGFEFLQGQSLFALE